MNWLLSKFLGRHSDTVAEIEAATKSPHTTSELDEQVAEAERQRIDSIRLRAEVLRKAERNKQWRERNHFADAVDAAWRRRHA
jgi:hypothetical protein